ncbi:MAG: DUF5615 family PIN-like protein [Candidatus Saccharimonas sp.]|nr:DUF5615 family PIN-like protein [Planctomycetaceae bacterium]
MAIAYYADVHVPSAVTEGLQRREVDVVTSADDGTREWADEELLRRATELGRVLVTQDRDFLGIAADWRAGGRMFAGIVYSHQERMAVGQLVHQLELLAKCGEPGELLNQVYYLPLR